VQLEHLSARLRDPRRELQEKAQRMDDLELRLGKAMKQKLERWDVRTGHLAQRLAMQSPQKQLSTSHETLGRIEERLFAATRLIIRQQRDRMEHLAQTLNVVSPLATLGRGYAIVRGPAGDIIRDADNLSPGDRVSARVARGEIEAEVISVKSGPE